VFSPNYDQNKYDVIEDIRGKYQAVKSMKIDFATIQTQLSKGLSSYKVGQNYKSSDGIYFTVEMDGSKRVARMITEKEAEASNPNFDAIDAFAQFDKVGDEIKNYVPVIQVDSNMPNNGVKLKNLIDVYKTMRDSRLDDKAMIDMSTLYSKRPLIKHYAEVANLMAKTEVSNFLTEKDHFDTRYIGEHPGYQDTEDIVSDDHWIDGITSMVSKNGFARAEVEKLAMRIVANSNVKGVEDVAEFVQNTNLVMERLTDPEKHDPLSHPRFQADETARFYKMSLRDPDKYKRRLDKMTEKGKAGMKEAVEKLKSLQDQIELGKKFELEGNDFLKMVEVRKFKSGARAGKVVVTPVEDYRRLSDTGKQKVREDFSKLPENIQQDLINYQLLQYGVDDKVGSLMDMFPDSVNLDYFKTIAPKKNFTEGERLSALYAMRNKLPVAKYEENKSLEWNKKGWVTNKQRDQVMFISEERTKVGGVEKVTRKLDNVLKPSDKSYDDNLFIKFDPEGMKISVPESQDIDEIIKKCK